jgi:predicted MPP superfamily phosphohydrolase
MNEDDRKMIKAHGVPRLVLLGAGCIVSLALTFSMVPPQTVQSDVVAPAMAAAALMLFFGPYLLAVGCTTGFVPELGSFWGVAAMLPFCVLHIAFLSVLSRRTSLWRRMGRFGERARKSVVIALAFVSVAGAWYEMPCVTRYNVKVDGGKVPAEGLRFALVTDLHSCHYGAGQRVLSEAILSLSPDAILLSGDIFDDRLPDDNVKAFLASVARARPCFYAFGNHEHWSERIPELRGILETAGVTVLDGAVRTVEMKGVKVDVCGIDDPTYMTDDEWLGQLASVATAANSSRLRILLSHRPEYSSAYANYDFDIVCSGHLHGGQWGVPGLGLGVCGPSSGGPDPSERLLFPRRAGGAYLLNGTTTMVISRGLARESTPLPRFFNHPEIVVIDLGQR